MRRRTGEELAKRQEGKRSNTGIMREERLSEENKEERDGDMANENEGEVV